MAVTREIAQKQMNQSPWEVRAEILRNAALRHEARARELNAEAVELRRIANDCDREATKASVAAEIKS